MYFLHIIIAKFFASIVIKEARVEYYFSKSCSQFSLTGVLGSLLYICQTQKFL